ncbi:fasciclin domain-containing protein [Nocardioides sp. AX2bis]|uniref:fasciclin domain-containing protein n=1 Tax=Nocardioides sp. AX2bis TaxID=2653157 RepID=UPI0012F29C81|nr:fasciclin domain-containing protein [Nocardioides sp. AX2bis]VXB95251.1 Cell surface glycolipoprotein MPT83 [Nocardioides sp. AX2bis]
MKTTNIRRNAGLAASAIALSVTLAACGDDATSTESSDTASESPSEAETPAEEETPSEEPAESEAAAGAGADTFGDACSAIPTSGPGSFDGMVQDPVGTAASTNPLLGTLVEAATAADLVGTLNDAEALTVFAPTDDAFAAIPPKTLKSVLADKQLLTQILTHHVIGEQLGPDEIAGTQDTLNQDTLDITGNADEGVTVANGDSGDATVLCGNIPTANATVYVIDQVLMPAA